tara:strand:- start:199 stop:660 length:462 start_codon:yes stop_codon:yes gene_type:complete
VSKKRISEVSNNKLIPKNKRQIESINATGEDISSLYYVVMLYNLSMVLEKKIFKKPKKFLRWCHTEHQKTIKSIKSPHSQFVWAKMNDGIFYTIDGVQVTLRHILKSIDASGNSMDSTDNMLFNYIDKYADDGSREEIWNTFNDIKSKYRQME